MEKIKLLVADDHPVFREGLCRLLEDEKDIEVVAKVGSGEEAVRTAIELSPDVAIIDVVMPGIGGLEAAKQIKAASPQIAILMLSAYDYGSYILASLQAGAAGYLLKGSSLGELAEAIRLAHAGEAVFNFRATNKALNQRGNTSRLWIIPGEDTASRLNASARHYRCEVTRGHF